MLAALREGLRQGDEGALWDLALYAGPWGFPLEDIKIPVELWQGTADRIVPSFHARVLANALARPTLKLVPGAGHYSLPLGHADEILASLALRSVTG
jgi:pimeloyl-ACP methyl ester carboxylesterase